MNESGYTPKNLKFGEEGREKLIQGITTIAKAVKSTLGPAGQTVLIESPNHTHGITVTKDGVTVAKAIDLLDPVENLAVRMMREAADRTATSAGDGTTTAIVLTEALVLEGVRLIDKTNKTETLRELVKLTNEVVESLEKNSRPVSTENIVDIATISANNDPAIGEVIAEIYNRVGKDGLVTVGKSHTTETHSEATVGIKVDRGYSSPMFINSQIKDECILEEVDILVSDAEISNILTIENILKPAIQNGKRLLIIAPCSTNVLNTLAANVVKSGLKICVVQPPNFGYRQHELMQDIAISVDATYFSEKTGDDLSVIEVSDLGHAKKIISSDTGTVILKDDGVNDEKINQRVTQLTEARENAEKKMDKEFISTRIASLTGGVGVIYVGGKTDLEQKELYDRVDDAVCAVKSALEEGILPGGGIALYREALKLKNKESSPASDMLIYALESPIYQIWENAGILDSKDSVPFTLDRNKDYSWGFNVKAERSGDMYEMGVIDPLKVTKNALQNAVSVAVTILSTDAIITMARSYEDV